RRAGIGARESLVRTAPREAARGLPAGPRAPRGEPLPGPSPALRPGGPLRLPLHHPLPEGGGSGILDPGAARELRPRQIPALTRNFRSPAGFLGRTLPRKRIDKENAMSWTTKWIGIGCLTLALGGAAAAAQGRDGRDRVWTRRMI